MIEREKLIKQYLEYELDAYHWIHLNDQHAISLENDKDHPLLPNCYVYRTESGIREYHVDMHPSFLNKKPSLSMWEPINVRPKVICGQDESVLKQNINPKQCWHNHKGTTKLLPKSDGYATMLSAIVSRLFGIGMELSEVEMRNMNNRRTNSTSPFRRYISKESAMEIYGSDLKKPLTCKHALVQYFELGINNQGYWNYHHMVIQCEDVFDVLSVRYPECDFVMLLVLSSGHTRKREGGLDENQLGNRGWTI